MQAFFCCFYSQVSAQTFGRADAKDNSGFGHE
jgi:hypothetical protein